MIIATVGVRHHEMLIGGRSVDSDAASDRRNRDKELRRDRREGIGRITADHAVAAARESFESGVGRGWRRPSARGSCS